MQTIGHVNRDTYLTELSHTHDTQKQSNPTHKQIPRPADLSLRAVVTDIYRSGGVAGFYKGLSLNLVKGPLTVAISTTSYDILKGVLLVEGDKSL